jgi:antitoxin HicB
MSELEKYLDLPYTMTVRRDDEGDFVGRIEELRGCSAHGKTPQEAIENLEEAKRLWIEDCLENGHAVPVPESEPLPSGRWLQRVPKTLHRQLQILSQKEGVSFNQYILSLLAEAVGERIEAQKKRGTSIRLSHVKALNCGYFIGEPSQATPLNWHVTNVTPAERPGDRLFYNVFLKGLSSRIPDKRTERIQIKGKKKDVKEEHGAYQLS